MCLSASSSSGRYSLLDDFQFPGLDGEVGLGKGDFLLVRVAVLGDEVAGVAGEHHTGYFPPAAGLKGDHFVGANEMVRNLVI